MFGDVWTQSPGVGALAATSSNMMMGPTAVLSAGQVYTIGTLTGAAGGASWTFPPGIVINQLSSTATQTGYVAKLFTNGTYQWVTRVTSDGTISSSFKAQMCAICDAGGSGVFVVGLVSGPTYFGSILRSDFGTATYGMPFVMRVGADGVVAWVHVTKSTVNGGIAPTACSYQASSNTLYWGGYFVALSGAPFYAAYNDTTYSIYSSPNRDAWVMKMIGQSVSWLVKLSTTSGTIRSIGIQAYIPTSTYYPIVGVSTPTISYVYCLNPDTGATVTPLSVVSPNSGSRGELGVLSITTSSYAYYIFGRFNGTTTICSTSLTATTEAVFLAKITGQGSSYTLTCQWARAYQESYILPPLISSATYPWGETAFALSAVSGTTIYAAFPFTAKLSLCSTTLYADVTDACILRLSTTDGTCMSAGQLTSSSAEWPTAILSDSENIYVSGYTGQSPTSFRTFYGKASLCLCSQGICSDSKVCHCYEGYGGSTCSTLCGTDGTCSGAGVCSLETGKCSCTSMTCGTNCEFAGYSAGTYGSCLCPLTSYLVNCTATCPANSWHYCSNDCRCKAGYTSNDPGKSAIPSGCKVCGYGKWSTALDSACSSCGAYSNTSSQTSTLSSQCLCSPGYTLSAGSCQICAINTYKDVLSNDPCSTCPTNSVSASGSTSPSQCKCSPGYKNTSFTPPATCDVCGYNYWKSATANTPCTACVSQATTVIQIATSVSDCACIKGYGYITGACSACSADYYKDARGNTDCTGCISNSGTNSATASDAKTKCLCKPGFWGNAGLASGALCTACGLGTYKNSWGNDVNCTACCSKSTTSSTGSTAITSCSCLPGYYGHAETGGPCQQCPLNTWKSALGNANSCTSCTGNSTTDTVLGADSISYCKCLPGFSGNASSSLGCSICQTNYYKIATSNGNCILCPTNSSNQKLGSSTRSDCKCDKGNYGDASTGSCTACPVNTYKDTWLNTGSCTSCTTSSTTLGLTGQKARSACICSKGYGGDASTGVCTACPLDQYKGTDANIACTHCTASSTNNKNTSITIQDCVCKAGYGGYANDTSGSCTLCPYGTYKASQGNSPCITGPPHTNTTALGATSLSQFYCLPGYTNFDSILGCSPCATATYKSDTSNAVCTPCIGNSTTLAVASILSSQCLCLEGFSLNTGVCTPCATGTFKNNTSNSACTPCVPNSTTLGTGKVSKSSCLCLPGYEGSAELSQCTLCQNNKYKQTTANALCGSCPSNSSTTSNHTMCLCNPGYGGPSCNPCLEGTYKSETSNNNCTTCPGNTTTINRAATGCMCLPGSGKSGNYCLLCQPGTYSLGGVGSCVPCPLHSTSTTNSSFCWCLRGYGGDATNETRGCTLCPEGLDNLGGNQECCVISSSQSQSSSSLSSSLSSSSSVSSSSESSHSASSSESFSSSLSHSSSSQSSSSQSSSSASLSLSSSSSQSSSQSSSSQLSSSQSSSVQSSSSNSLSLSSSHSDSVSLSESESSSQSSSSESLSSSSQSSSSESFSSSSQSSSSVSESSYSQSSHSASLSESVSTSVSKSGSGSRSGSDSGSTSHPHSQVPSHSDSTSASHSHSTSHSHSHSHSTSESESPADSSGELASSSPVESLPEPSSSSGKPNHHNKNLAWAWALVSIAGLCAGGGAIAAGVFGCKWMQNKRMRHCRVEDCSPPDTPPSPGDP